MEWKLTKINKTISRHNKTVYIQTKVHIKPHIKVHCFGLVVFNATPNNMSVMLWDQLYWLRKPEYP